MKNWLDQSAELYPDKIAVIYYDKSLKFKELQEKSLNLASKLDIYGIKKGQHIGIHLNNSLEHIILIFALIYLKCISVPLNTRLTQTELEVQVKHVDLSLIISNNKLSNVSCDKLNLKDLSQEGKKDFLPTRSIDLEALHCIIFTSGTTNLPKGVMLTYGNHYASAISSKLVLGSQEDDIWLNCISLFHVGGLEIIFRSTIYGTALTLHENFDVERIISSILKDKVTLISLVPIMLRRLLENEEFSVNSLRHVLLGGAKTFDDLSKSAIGKGFPIAPTYGMTEACSQISTATYDLHLVKPSSVGLPLDGLDIKIAKLNSKDDFGEIMVKGPSITSGYYKQDELNRQRFKEGYLLTGDLGYLDDEGILYILSRHSDLIITGGENVNPQEVENVIRGVSQITEIVVFGITDRTWGQKVVAAVTLSAEISLGEINAYCRKHLAGYKIPKVFRIFTTLPQTTSGKIKRNELKSLFPTGKMLQ